MIVASVPGAGTHTLLKLFPEAGGFLHFYPTCSVYEMNSTYRIMDYPGRVVVPIRDPLAVTLTWDARNHGRTDNDELPFWEYCIRYCVWNNPWMINVEDLPCRENRSLDNWWREDYENRIVPDLSSVEVLRKWIEPYDWFWLERGYDLWWR